MSTMRWQVEGVARSEQPWRALPFDLEARGAGQDHDPLSLVLIVPKSVRRRLPMRYDAFDPDRSRLVNNLCDLGAARIGQIVEQRALIEVARDQLCSSSCTSTKARL